MGRFGERKPSIGKKKLNQLPVPTTMASCKIWQNKVPYLRTLSIRGLMKCTLGDRQG